jgi:pyruvate/2-oxoglutarate dehydrogenase complex dihydrolipoamide dehydrogenase (E3) component
MKSFPEIGCHHSDRLSRIPNIPGIDQPFVHDVRIVYEKPIELGSDIVILGGGDIGCETADFLSSQSKHVTIVEMFEEPLKRKKEIPREELLKRLKDRGVTIITRSKAREIRSGGVIIEEKNGTQKECVISTLVPGVSPSALFFVPFMTGWKKYTLLEMPGSPAIWVQL